MVRPIDWLNNTARLRFTVRMNLAMKLVGAGQGGYSSSFHPGFDS
jgi:hypothetical protein